jgi:hypothetical protein
MTAIPAAGRGQPGPSAANSISNAQQNFQRVGTPVGAPTRSLNSTEPQGATTKFEATFSAQLSSTSTPSATPASFDPEEVYKASRVLFSPESLYQFFA